MAGKSPSPCSLSFSFSLLTSVSFSQQPRAGQVASLQMLSAWRLSECLTPANCLSVLAVAEDLRATPLVRTTLDYLSSHLVEVVGAMMAVEGAEKTVDTPERRLHAEREMTPL